MDQPCLWWSGKRDKASLFVQSCSEGAIKRPKTAIPGSRAGVGHAELGSGPQVTRRQLGSPKSMPRQRPLDTFTTRPPQCRLRPPSSPSPAAIGIVFPTTLNGGVHAPNADRYTVRTAPCRRGRQSVARVDAVADCGAVFHLAGIPGVRASWGERFGDYVAANIMGTARLLNACEQAKVGRLVFASSSSVYGSVEGPSRETDATRPISPYGVTKLAAEQLCLAHSRRLDTGLVVCALRYFTVYGP